MIVKHKYFYHFPKCETDTPIVCKLIREYSLDVNIYRAKVTAEGEGYLLLELRGDENDIQRANDFVRTGFGVSVNTVDKGVMRDPQKCTHCGNCLAHCPTHALRLQNTDKRLVEFDETQCVACGKCVTNCPMGACSSVF